MLGDFEGLIVGFMNVTVALMIASCVVNLIPGSSDLKVECATITVPLTASLLFATCIVHETNEPSSRSDKHAETPGITQPPLGVRIDSRRMLRCPVVRLSKSGKKLRAAHRTTSERIRQIWQCFESCSRRRR